jgi:hypothetical protein
MSLAAVISRAVGRSANRWRRRSRAASRVVQVGDVPAECHSGPVCCHIQGVHHLAVKILDVALCFQGRWLGMAAMRFDQMPGAGEVVGDLRQSFVGRSCPGQCPVVMLRPIASPTARSRSSDPTLTGCPAPKAIQPTARPLTRSAVPAPHHGRRVIGCRVEERLAGQLVAVGQ